MQGLTAAHEQQLHSIFLLFARAPSGGAPALGVNELGAFLAALQGAPYPEAPALLARYGEGRGAITFPSFVQLVCSEPLPGLGGAPVESASAVRQELVRVFSAADGDGDAALGAAEVRAVLEADGAPASEAEVQAVLEEAGAREGRGVTLEQFLRLCVGTQVL